MENQIQSVKACLCINVPYGWNEQHFVVFFGRLCVWIYLHDGHYTFETHEGPKQMMGFSSHLVRQAQHDTQ